MENVEITIIGNGSLRGLHEGAVGFSGPRLVLYKDGTNRMGVSHGDQIMFGGSLGGHYYLAVRAGTKIGHTLRLQGKGVRKPKTLVTNSNDFKAVKKGYYNLGQKGMPDANGLEWFPLIKV